MMADRRRQPPQYGQNGIPTREEMQRRYVQACFRSAANEAERLAQMQGQHPENTQEGNSEPEAPTLAQIMGVKRHNDIGPGMTEDARLRRWAGLK